MNSTAVLPAARVVSLAPRFLFIWWKAWSRKWEPSLFFEDPDALPSAKLRKQMLLVTHLFWLLTGICAVALVVSWLYL